MYRDSNKFREKEHNKLILKSKWFLSCGSYKILTKI